MKSVLPPVLLEQFVNAVGKKDYNIHAASKGSNVRCVWRCEKGHEWEATIKARAAYNSGCPYCAGQKPVKGENDLATTHPSLVQQWNHARNSYTPEEVKAGTSKKVWWVCESGHEWESSIISRAKRGDGCPYCSGRNAISGVNDLATVYPHIATQFHPTKNHPVTVDKLKPTSHTKIWWICGEGHEWLVSPASRLSKKETGCPYCSGRYANTGKDDLPSTNPELLSEWNYSKNNEDDVTPEGIKAGSNKEVWWVCSQNHEWKARTAGRIKGQGCPYCANKKVLKGFNDLTTTHPDLAKQLHPTSDALTTSGSEKRLLWVCDTCTHEWTAFVYSRKAGNGCPKCALGKAVTKGEKEIASFLRTLNLTVETSNRSVLGGKELDIYIPEKKFAVEFNGIYWHNENHKPRNYHYDKWKDCQQKDIQLVQIWEDDWLRNPDLVKRMLAHKLGVSQEKRVYGRQTSIHQLTWEEAKPFLNENHIQGAAIGSYYLGLKDNEDQLVAVLVLKKESGTAGRTLNIIRYATSCNVVGGFTKLLKHAERTYAPEKFITFADHCVSDGGLYENNGFVADKELPPDYMYVVKQTRQHKFGYRLKRFRDDPNLIWQDGLTERELASLNRLHRIWDAGKTRWVKPLTS